MTGNNHRHILWTARNTPMPKGLWDRLEERGYKVLVGEEADHDPLRIGKISPRLWVCQSDGRPDSDLSDLRRVLSRFPDLPVILVSDRPTVEEAVRAIKSGVTDYLSAEASAEQMWFTMEGALQSRGNRRGRAPSSDPSARDSRNPIAADRVMQNVIRLAERISKTRATVLIQGESGTGKEVIARHIHRKSNRRGSPFIAVNCAALPENLLESELFGHEKGAFTGAVTRKKGKFELADGGTLLLDEISEMAVSIQAKLLRALQEKEIDRVGGQFTVPVDVRVLATTNRDLGEETRKGNFRLDLFYRLNVVPIVLPPLRNRQDDIVPLARFFLRNHGDLHHMVPKRLAPDAESLLKRRTWPGNVRELENLMERATLLIEGDTVRAGDLEAISLPEGETPLEQSEQDNVLPLKDMEKRMIFRALHDHDGNRTHAARVLGISVRTLRNKLHEYQQDGEACSIHG